MSTPQISYWTLVISLGRIHVSRLLLVIGHWTMYKFENLRVWREAVKLVKMVYELCKKLPRDERFALADQLKRASTSIVLNIAEGCGGLGDVELRSYLRNSLKSLYETVAAVKLVESLFDLSCKEILEQCDLVGKQLNAFIRSLKSKS